MWNTVLPAGHDSTGQKVKTQTDLKNSFNASCATLTVYNAFSSGRKVAAGLSKHCIAGSWTCFSFSKTYHRSSKKLLQFWLTNWREVVSFKPWTGVSFQSLQSHVWLTRLQQVDKSNSQHSVYIRSATTYESFRLIKLMTDRHSWIKFLLQFLKYQGDKSSQIYDWLNEKNQRWRHQHLSETLRLEWQHHKSGGLEKKDALSSFVQFEHF